MTGFNFDDYFNGVGGAGSGGSGSGGSATAAGLLASMWLVGVGAPVVTEAGGVYSYTDAETGNSVEIEAGAKYLDLSSGDSFAFDDVSHTFTPLQSISAGNLLWGANDPTGADGFDGARWVNTATGGIFTRTAGVWAQEGSLQGPQGPTGPANGREFLSYSGLPPNDQGKDGDTALDLTTGNYYRKLLGAWTATGQSAIGPQGPTGKNAYELWLDEGNQGTLADFFFAFKGDPGSPGGFSFRAGQGAPISTLGLVGDAYADLADRGRVYFKADNGQGSGVWIESGEFIGANELIAGNGLPTAEIGLVGDLYFDLDNQNALYQKVTSTAWVGLGRTLGAKGDPGQSVYDVWLASGNVGSEVQFLATLKGDTGISAYDTAVANGYIGTVQEWLDSLIGAAGESAYEAHVRIVTEAGGTPFATEAEWLASLKGETGEAGSLLNPDGGLLLVSTTATQDIAGAFGGSWQAASKQTSTTDVVRGGGSRATAAIMRSAIGSGADGPANADYALHVESKKTDYLTSTVAGEIDVVNAVGRQSGGPGAGDMSIYLGNAHRVPSTGNGMSVFEGQSTIVDGTGVVQKSMKVTSGIWNEGVADLRNNGVGVLVRPDTDGSQIDHAFLVLGYNATAGTGVRNLIKASATMDDADSYFVVTGDQHADGGGKVRAKGGNTSRPAFAYIGDENTGLTQVGEGLQSPVNNGTKTGVFGLGWRVGENMSDGGLGTLKVEKSIALGEGTGEDQAKITKMLKTVVSGLDFASIAAGAVGEIVVPLAGVAIGDEITVAPHANFNHQVILRAVCVGANSVTISALNTSAAAIDLLAFDCSVFARRFA